MIAGDHSQIINLLSRTCAIFIEFLCGSDLQLRQAKAEVVSVSNKAMRFVFGPPAPASPGSSDAASGDSPGNLSRRFAFMGSPSRLLARGSPTSSQNGSSGRSSGQSSDSSETPVIQLPWK